MAEPIKAIEGSCVHYTGVFGPGTTCCAAGVNYRELVDTTEPGWVRKLPCSTALQRNPVSCSKLRLPTAEEVRAYEAWWDEHFKLVQVAVERCRGDAAGKRGVRGTVECPACKGKLNYSVASSNGHLWGGCETKDCLRWMQ